MPTALSQNKPALARLSEDFPKIRNFTTTAQLDEVVNYMVTILNIKVSNDAEIRELNKQMVMILQLLRNKFGSLTAEEVKEAFQMYVAHEFDIKVFRLLDCVAVGEVLNAYTNYRNERLRAYNEKKTAEAQKQPEPTPEEILAMLKDGANRMYLEYKETKLVSDPSEYMFNFLYEQGKLPLNDKLQNNKYYTAFYQKAKKVARVEHSKIKGATQFDRDTLKAELDEILKGKSNKIIILAKKMALEDFFKKQLTKKAELIFPKNE